MSFITALWSKQPGKFFSVSTKDAQGRWHDHFFDRAHLDRVDDFIRSKSHCDVYFCPHGFNSRQRKEESAELPSMLWSDMDEANPNKIKWKPTVAIESSPGRFVGLWYLDETMDKKLNQRLSYAIGADKGGWDITQVLRVPHTTNYKYQSTPRVRLLWDDGPKYKRADLENDLPNKLVDLSDDAETMFKKQKHKFPVWLRNELFNGTPRVGKRSAMLWKMELGLLEAGMSKEQTLILIKASPWNKFNGRENEDRQLQKEIEKAAGEIKANKTKKRDDEEPVKLHFLSRSLDEVEETEMDWIWYPYLAQGEVTIVEGDPGSKKSFMMQMVAKGLLDGERLPSVKQLPIVKCKVAAFDFENDAGKVTKKRMRFNGCKNMKHFYQEEEPFSIDNEKATDALFEAIDRVRPLLVIFDTINLYIGKADTSKANETTQALSIFKEIAKRYHCSVVLVRHLTKGNSKEKAIYRGQGSIAFAGVARILITVGKHPEDPETSVMAITKLNNAATPRGLSFTVTAVPDTLKERDRAKFEWGEFVDLNSEQILHPSDEKDQGSSKDDAREFLEEVLADGSVDQSRVIAMAEARSISKLSLQRAATLLGINRADKRWRLRPKLKVINGDKR